MAHRFVIFVDCQTECPSRINDVKYFKEIADKAIEDVKVYSMSTELSIEEIIAFENLGTGIMIEGNAIDMATDFSKGRIDSDVYCMSILEIK